MPGQLPPEETRFPVNRQNHTQKGPYLGPLLKKILEGRFDINDPTTGQKLKAQGKKALMLRLVWSGLEGDVSAIKEILDRVDGKVAQKSTGQVTYTVMPSIQIDGKDMEYNIGN